MRRNRSLLSVLLFPLTAVLVVLGSAVQAQQTTDTRERKTDTDSAAFYRALDLEGQGKYREAAALFLRSLRGPSRVSALLGLERSYAELQLADSLLAPLDTLIRLEPRETVYRAVLLRTLQTLGRDAEAHAAFERWVRETPDDAAPYREYARLLLQRGQALRADSVLRAASHLRGGDLQLEIAQTRAAMGQWDASAQAWRAALVNAPYLEQAAAYALAPAPSASRDSIRARFFTSPVLVAARRTLATLEAAWGSPANGWLALRDLPADSASAAAWLDFAQRAEAEERWTQARDALSAALRWRHSPAVALRAAVAALNSGDPAGALELAPITGSGADSARVARTLLPVHVRALAALGRPASAERLVAAYERWLTPTTRAALARSIAFGWVRIGDMSRARGALTVAGPDADSSDAAGWLALYAGDVRTARRLLRAGGDASPDLAIALAIVARVSEDSAPQLGRAFLSLARGDTGIAAMGMVEAADRLPDAASILLYTAGQLRAAVKDEPQAIALWSRVVEQYAMSAEAPAAELEWGRALRRRGDSAGAARRLEHLILTYPQSALVPQARRDLELTRRAIPPTP